jgi:hypothetical protein
MTGAITKTFLRDMGREMYLKSISVWLSPSMKLARTFKEMQDIPKDILRNAEDIYESQFKDIVERKVDATMEFNEEMRRLYPGKNVLRPRPPIQIRISQPSV